MSTFFVFVQNYTVLSPRNFLINNYFTIAVRNAKTERFKTKNCKNKNNV